MTTTIRTSSKQMFDSLTTYLYNHRVPSMINRDDNLFSVSIFDYSTPDLKSKIDQLVKRFHLKPLTSIQRAA